MKRLQYWIRNYFGFNRIETNGVLVLMGLLVIFIFSNSWIGFLFPTPPTTIKQRNWDSLNQVIIELQKPQPLKLAELSPFDPNTFQAEDWKKIGLPERLANTLGNYTQKGGKFWKKEDLLKIHGFSESYFQQLEPYIAIVHTSKSKNYSTYKKDYNKKTYNKKEKTDRKSYEPKPKKVIVPFELNTADTSQLRQISGIGAVLSERIVKYRDNVGGFTSWQQLSEVWGLKPEVIEKMQQYASIDATKVKSIAINTATYEELKAHPYIKYQLAKVIVSYRQQHGNFASEADLAKIKIMNTETLEKLRGYIRYD